MSEYILNTAQQSSKLDWAFPFQRAGAFPLDRSSLFSSLTDAQNYAKGVLEDQEPADERGLAGTSYVGQPISVYDEASNSVSLYIINADRGLQQVGAATLTDNFSIEIIDDKIQLKNFGKGYYAYIPAEKDSDGNIISNSKYEYTEGFKEGLEPKIVLNENNNLEIGWYEPNQENIEKITLSVNELSSKLDEAKELIGIPKTDEKESSGLYKILEEKANSSDVYTKSEILEKFSEIAHLKRVKVNSINDINVNAEDAENIIYMVPTGFQAEDNKYNEYVVIDGIIEKVGTWEVELSDYAKYDDVIELLNKKIDKSDTDRLITQQEIEKLKNIVEGAEKNYISSVSSDFSVVEGNLSLNIISQDKVSNLTQSLDNINQSLNNKVEKEIGSRLMTSSEAERLSSIKDLIQAVDGSNFSLSNDGLLSLKQLEINDIANLSNTLNNKVEKEDGSRLITQEEANKLSALSIDEDGSVGVSATVSASNVQELYNNVVRIVTGQGTAVYDEGLKNLLNIQPGAQKNFISSVNSSVFTVSDSGELDLNKISISHVDGLASILNSKASASYVSDIEVRLNSMSDNYSKRFTDIENTLTWKTI